MEIGNIQITQHLAEAYLTSCRNAPQQQTSLQDDHVAFLTDQADVARMIAEASKTKLDYDQILAHNDKALLDNKPTTLVSDAGIRNIHSLFMSHVSEAADKDALSYKNFTSQNVLPENIINCALSRTIKQNLSHTTAVAARISEPNSSPLHNPAKEEQNIGFKNLLMINAGTMGLAHDQLAGTLASPSVSAQTTGLDAADPLKMEMQQYVEARLAENELVPQKSEAVSRDLIPSHQINNERVAASSLQAYASNEHFHNQTSIANKANHDLASQTPDLVDPSMDHALFAAKTRQSETQAMASLKTSKVKQHLAANALILNKDGKLSDKDLKFYQADANASVKQSRADLVMSFVNHRLLDNYQTGALDSNQISGLQKEANLAKQIATEAHSQTLSALKASIANQVSAIKTLDHSRDTSQPESVSQKQNEPVTNEPNVAKIAISSKTSFEMAQRLLEQKSSDILSENAATMPTRRVSIRLDRSTEPKDRPAYYAPNIITKADDGTLTYHIAASAAKNRNVIAVPGVDPTTNIPGKGLFVLETDNTGKISPKSLPRELKGAKINIAFDSQLARDALKQTKARTQDQR